MNVHKDSLEQSIEDILDYFRALAFKLNADKTELIVFGKKNQPQSLQNREQKMKRKLK